MSMSSSELIPHSRRNDNETKMRKQAAANALQNYSILMLHATRDNESPAKTRLKMMRLLTELPAQDTKKPKRTLYA
ncbi:hypothetical protein BDF14DRAFT_1887151 [Spinellus fusiger]|nr:hypothetical protein BDF14DRAFT_1887151 [Spinellus fusiger]